MVKDKIVKLLNKQLNEELLSSYEYLAMSAHFDLENLTGFAHWFKLQSQEEYGHAMKIFSYITQVNGKVQLKQIDAPKSSWKNLQDVLNDAYKREQAVTKSIYEIVDATLAEKDHATFNFLQWFVNEQVEEEASALKWLDRAKLLGADKNGIFLLDREMARRAGEK